VFVSINLLMYGLTARSPRPWSSGSRPHQHAVPDDDLHRLRPHHVMTEIWQLVVLWPRVAAAPA